jgi:hypothetical protein
MTPLFHKLNLGSHRDILVLNAPDSFEGELAALVGVAIRRDTSQTPTIPFALVFVRTLAEVEAAAAALFPKATEDAVIWFAYPKASSRRYRCEFNRDTGWAAVVRGGFESVRQVAIDEDWSALRFRRREFVKTRNRDESQTSQKAGKGRGKKDKPAEPGSPADLADE